MADIVERAIYSAEVRGKEDLAKLGQTLDQVATSSDKVTRATRSTADSVEKLIASYDKQQRTLNQYYAKLQQLKDFEADGVGTAARRAVANDLVTEALKRQLIALDGTAATIEKLRPKFDAAGQSAVQMTRELAELHAAQKVGINIAGGYEAAETKIIAKYNEGAAAATRAKEAVDALGRSQERVTRAGNATNPNALNFFNNSLGAGSTRTDQRVLVETARQAQQAEVAIQDAAAAQAHFNQLLGVTRTGPTRADWIAQFEQGAPVAQRGTAALRNFNTAQGETAVGSRQLGFLMTNLTFQINDVVTGLASGQGAFRVFAQQGGQIFQIFQLGGRQLLAGILSWITPLTVAGAAVLALGGAFAILLKRTFDNDDALRKFDVTLNGVSRSSETTAQGLFNMERQLRAIGFSAEDANKAISTLRANPNVNRGAIGQLAITGADVGARLGIGSVEGVNALSTAIKGGVDATLDFGFALDAITLKQARSIQETARQGNQTKALNDAIKIITANIAGDYNRSLSEAEKATNSVGAAWTRLLDKLANTTIVQGAKNALIDLLNAFNGTMKVTEEELNRVEERRQMGIRNAQRPMGAPRATETGGAGGAAPVAGINYGTGGAISGAANQYIGQVDKTLVDAFNLTQAITGLSASIGLNPTGGRHVAGSQHYNASAFDYNVGGYTHSEAMVPGSAQDAYIMFDYIFKRMTPGVGRGGTNFSKFDPGHVDLGLASGLPPGMNAADMDARAIALGADRMISNYFARQGTTGPQRLGGTSPLGGFNTGLPRTGSTSADADAIREDTAARSANQKAVDDANKAAEAAIRINKERGIQLQYDITYQQVYTEAIKNGSLGWEAENLAKAKAGEVSGVMRDNLQKENAERAMEIGNIKGTAEAFKISEAAGYREQALGEARLQTLNSQNDTTLVFNQILQKNAAQAIQTGMANVAAARPQINATERIAEAAKKGAAAQHEAEVVAAATRQTQDAVARAEASRNPILIAQAEALQKVALSEAMRNEKAKVSLANQEALRTEEESRKVLAVEIGSTNELTERQQTLVTLTRTKIELEKQGEFSSQKDKDARLASVAATQQMNEKLAQANREQQRFEDGIRSIASAVENELTKSIENAFSGEKVETWGARIKRMLGSLATSLSDAFFIKPLLGTLAGLVAPNVGAQLGTFGNLFGGGGSSQTLTGTVGGQPATFNLSNVSSGFNILDKIGSELGGSSGGATNFLSSSLSGVKNFFNTGLGGTFASPGLLSTESATSLANMIGIESSTFNAIPGIVTNPGIFGSATLGQAFGGIGAGFGAGTLLNSLAGGNSTTGTIGSGVGSLAGFALGSLVGMPFLGALVGGAGGGLLGGLFGGKKPDLAGSATIDLLSGKVSPFTSAGNAQNDQTAQQLIQGITSFSQSVKQLTGGTIGGSLTVAAGSRRGIVLEGSVGDIQGEARFGQDAEKALGAAKLAILHELTDISDTMKNIIGQVTDPADAENAIKFASAYEDLTKAFDNAFSSISTDAKVVGPFSIALDQLNATFKDLTENAIKYNVSLDPVNAGQKEAIKRLNESFELFLKQQEVASSGSSEFLSPAFAAHQQFLQNINDATALGLNSDAMKTRIAAIEQNTLRTILEPLTREQIQIVIDAMKTLAPEVSDFATTMLNTSKVVEKVTENVADLYKSLVDLRTQLTTGPSSGLTAAEQVRAAEQNFNRTLALVRGGNKEQIATLASQGQNLISLSESTYGNGPQTSVIRNMILEAINQVLGAVNLASKTIVANDNTNLTIKAAFATGTRNTPPGTILVGERGPELISQPGGLRIWNSRETEMLLSPAANNEMIGKLDLVISLLSGGNTIAREHGAISERGFATLTGQVDQMSQPTFEAPARRNVA